MRLQTSFCLGPSSRFRNKGTIKRYCRRGSGGAGRCVDGIPTDRNLLDEADTRAAIEYIIEELDKGHLRVAEPPAEEGAV